MRDRRLLVIDDEPVFCEFVRRVAESEGFDVAVARDGDSFKQAYLEREPAAIILDLVMPDVARIGGVSGWLQAAATAAARGIPMSSHLMPELSGHLLAATPTCHWLEYVDWADVLVQEPLRIDRGRALVPDRPGAGMVWDKAAVRHYRLA